MSEYSKKLHINYNGTQEDIKLYTATNDVGSNYLSINDGTTISYAKLDTSTGTNLHIKKNNTIYNVMKEAVTVKGFILPVDCKYYMNKNYHSTYQTMTVLPNELQTADASNVTNMYGMFYGCHYLTTIPQFDTSNVTNMSRMFVHCPNLTTIPLLNTSKVTDMENMFASCPSLKTIPQLDTSKVTNMNGMFQVCKSLPSVLSWVIDCSSIISINNIKYIFDDSPVKEATFKNVKSSLASQFTAANLGLTRITIQNTI